MKIKELIRHRIDSGNFQLHDREGNPVPTVQAQQLFAKIQTYLTQKNVKICAIKLQKDYHYLLTMLACMEMGITYIPLMADYPTDRIQQIFEDTQFDLLLTEDDFKLLAQSSVSPAQSLQISDNNPLYTIFTSGSTGRPKGVAIPRSAYENYLNWLQEEIVPNFTDKKLLQVTQFTFDISLIDVGLFILTDAPIYFSQFDANIFRLAYEIETYKISFLNTVPNNIRMLLDDMVMGRADLSSLNLMLIGGARFSWGLYTALQNSILKNSLIYNVYGPTESTVYSHAKKITFDVNKDSINHTISIGKPIVGVDALIMSEGKLVATGQSGELWLGGKQLMLGYVNNPERTSEALVQYQGDVFYRTGDIAFESVSGDTFITGRMDDTIKYRGYRINLLDIDSYICKLPFVKDSVTVAIPDELTENKTICFLICNQQLKVTEVKQAMREYLLEYQIPEKIIFTDHYPVNNSGKVDKKQLIELAKG